MPADPEGFEDEIHPPDVRDGVLVGFPNRPLEGEQATARFLEPPGHLDEDPARSRVERVVTPPLLPKALDLERPSPRPTDPRENLPHTEPETVQVVAGIVEDLGAETEEAVGQPPARPIIGARGEFRPLNHVLQGFQPSEYPHRGAVKQGASGTPEAGFEPRGMLSHRFRAGLTR